MKKKEQLLWAAYHEDRCVEARNKLVEEYLPLLKWIILNLGFKHDDQLPLGCILLIQAVERFDPSHGIDPTGYLIYRITRELRRRTARKFFADKDRAVYSLLEDDAPQVTQVHQVDEDDAFDYYCSGLPDRQGQVIRMRYQEGLSTKEIAGLLGTSKQAVYDLHKRAIRKLGETLNAV